MAFAKKFTIYTEFKKITGLQPGGHHPASRAPRLGANLKENHAAQTCRAASFRVEMENHRGAAHAGAHGLGGASIENRGGLVGGQLSRRRQRHREGAGGAPPTPTIPSKEPFEIADLMQQNERHDPESERHHRRDAAADRAGRGLGPLAAIDQANRLMIEVSGDLKTMAGGRARGSPPTPPRYRADREQRQRQPRQAGERRTSSTPARDQCREAGGRDRDQRRAPSSEAGADHAGRIFNRRTVRSKEWRRGLKQTMDDARKAIVGLRGGTWKRFEAPTSCFRGLLQRSRLLQPRRHFARSLPSGAR